MEKVQSLLSDLRDEAEVLTMLHPNDSLESLFNGSLICHMASKCKANPSLKIDGAVQVVISHLATTRIAAAEAKSSNLDFPLPGLNTMQMDGFLNTSHRMRKLKSLRPREKALILTSLRLSDYLGILFNWDLNSVCFQEDHRGYSIPQAKNVVLETVYSIGYRVDGLLKNLLFEVNKSFSNVQDKDHDPGTILCALWIVYASIHKFKKLNWDAKSLQNLKVFLNGLHEGAAGAMKAIERCRRELAWLSCMELSTNCLLFKDLVKDPKVPKSVIAFTYERFEPSDLLFLQPVFSTEMSYTDMLEARVPDTEYLGTYRLPPYVTDKAEYFGVAENMTVAEFYKCDGTLQSQSYAGPVSSILVDLCSTASKPSNEPGDFPPSLTRTGSTKDESLLSLSAQIQRVEDVLKVLKQKAKRSLKENSNMHKDCPEYMQSVGPSNEIEMAQLNAKATRKISGVSASLARNNSRKARKRKQRASNTEMAEPMLPRAVGSFPYPPTHATSAKRAWNEEDAALVTELDKILEC